MVEMILEAYLSLLFPMAVWALFWYLLAMLIGRNDLVDVAWGFGFLYIIYWLAHLYPLRGEQILLFFPVAIWAIRLGSYLFVRSLGKSEDKRYAKWRKEWGKQHWWRSFLQIYVLQNVLMLIIAMPLVYVSISGHLDWSLWIIPGLLLWAYGMYWESIADWQKARFKMNPDNKGKICQEGLWSKSRHPNYFGEICIWWGVWLSVMPYHDAWITIISPLLITYLLLKVSGVPMLERKKAKYIDYQQYMRDVPAVFPKALSFPRNRKSSWN